MSETSEKDAFSWREMVRLLESKLEQKLSNVAKSDDVVALKSVIDELKTGNAMLKDEIKKLNKGVDRLDRHCRRSNVIVRGLKCKNVISAKNKFYDICATHLNMEIDIIKASKFTTADAFCFTLESHKEARKVLRVKDKVREQQIFIEKDYTDAEQTVRYQMRTIMKAIQQTDSDVKVRLGHFYMVINKYKYRWCDGVIMANMENEYEFLKNLLEKCNCNFEVDYEYRGLL